MSGPSTSRPMVLPSRENEWQLTHVELPVINKMALRLRNIAQPPRHQSKHVLGQRADDSLLAFARNQRHIAIEDGRAHRIFRGCNYHLAARNCVLLLLIGESGDGNRRRLFNRPLLDFGPRLLIGSPGVSRGLFGRQHRRLVVVAHHALVDFADLQRRSVGLLFDLLAAAGKGHFDAPTLHLGIRIAPAKDRRNNLRRKNGTVVRVVDDDFRELRRLRLD